MASGSKTITKSSNTFYTIYVYCSIDSQTDTTATIAWKSYIKFGPYYNYGVKLKTYVDGDLVKTASGYTSSTNSKCCVYSGTHKISKTTSSRTVTVKAKSSSATVSGYGGVGSSYTGTASCTFTLKAITSYTVSYNANGGSGAPSSQTKYYGKTLTLSSTKPTRTGYSFLGWSTSSSATSATYSAGGSYTSNSSATLYAVWKANTYTVSYNANGGSGAPSSQTKTYGVTLTLSSTKPTRSGYNFMGWGTSSSTTTVSYKAGASYTANAAITLYAVWEVAGASVSSVTAYRCDGSGGPVANGSYAFVSVTAKSAAGDSKLVSASATANGVTASLDISGLSANGVIDANMNSDEAYTVDVTVADSKGSGTGSTKIPSSFYMIDFSPSGGVGIGAPALDKKSLNIGTDINYQVEFDSAPYLTGTSPNLAFGHTHSTTGTRICFGVGDGGYNRGTYDSESSLWQIYNDSANQTYIPTTPIVGGHSTAIGSVLSTSTTTSKSISKATTTQVLSLSIPAGTWILVANVNYDTTSDMKLGASINSTSASNSSISRTYFYISSGDGLTNLSRVVSQSSTTTWYVNVYMASAGSIDNAYLYAARIA